MIWQFDIIILTLVIVSALSALRIRDLLGSAIIFGVYSFLMCLLWAGMGAVDVAFTEATVGAGISTVLILATVLHTKRRTKD
ncbi:MAG: DUF4040 domain-containing protein [Candidatus Margulisbacteria bacterium]|nr:DUF4040 domain-containing protein [Candidatus Margulisiibacteriota bacterium]